MCDVLGRCIGPDDDDAKIQDSLKHVWFLVEGALSEDPEVIERLANVDEFEANVKDEGVKKVIELLRDTAKKGSWLDMIENRIFFKPILEDTEPISTASADAFVRAWDTPFEGDAADLLLESIPMYLEEGMSLHANIVNSSGTGKSRMVDEVAKKIITVPMCLRENGNRGFTLLFSLFVGALMTNLIGFPPPDTALRDRMPKDSWTGNLLCSIFAVLHGRLEAIASEMPMLTTSTNLTSHERDERASAVRQHQEVLASAFRDLLTRGQSLEQSNAYRRSFYQEYEARDRKELHEDGSNTTG
ncbi:hypothetical protein BGY98DRAFT_935949 [Russula aff. rugulosa BPL654]|nr:hypothetical protein BGY98DRAFT_935949 [Russula aff. rugulosa BPL654]